MKAYQVRRYGGPDVLELTEVPSPTPAEGELLVEIRAASVNPIDFKVRSGKAKPILPYKLPFTLGHDFSGVVRALGPGVSGFSVGDEVFARPEDLRIGAFAEQIAVPASVTAHKPKTLSHVEAASLPLVGLTAYQSLFEFGGLKAGERVLIHGGAGGVGSLAVQLAKSRGAHVLATASGKNVERVKALGADEVIDYTAQRFEDVAKDIDLVFDTIGEDTLMRSFRCLEPGGRVVSISGPPDAAFAKRFKVAFPVRLVLSLMARKTVAEAKKRGVSYQYVWMHADAAQLRELAALVESGKLKTQVDRVFPFAQAKDAIAFAESGKARGKVVVEL